MPRAPQRRRSPWRRGCRADAELPESPHLPTPSSRTGRGRSSSRALREQGSAGAPAAGLLRVAGAKCLIVAARAATSNPRAAAGYRRITRIPRLNPDVGAILPKLREVLAREYGQRLRPIILFGSRINGSAGGNSDLDVAVLLAGPVEDSWEEEVRPDDRLRALRPRVDLHVFSEGEFNRQAPVPGTLAFRSRGKAPSFYERAGSRAGARAPPGGAASG